jgi:hypothetical protein
MSDILINNETEYTLPATILNQIQRDAIEYFGESVHTIRIQYGIERHAFNAKTGEVRYSFSPGDFGIVDTLSSLSDDYSRDDDVPSIDDDREDIPEIPFDEIDMEDDDTPSFGSLEDDLDVVADDDSPKFQSLDTDFESLEDAESNFLYDEGYDC